MTTKTKKTKKNQIPKFVYRLEFGQIGYCTHFHKTTDPKHIQEFVDGDNASFMTYREAKNAIFEHNIEYGG